MTRGTGVSTDDARAGGDASSAVVDDYVEARNGLLARTSSPSTAPASSSSRSRYVRLACNGGSVRYSTAWLARRERTGDSGVAPNCGIAACALTINTRRFGDASENMVYPHRDPGRVLMPGPLMLVHIRCENPANARHDLLNLPGREIEVLVERNVVGHACALL